MASTDWDFTHPTDLQDYSWDCSACSAAWCTRTLGSVISEQDMIAALGPARISATYGLLDASGAGLAECLTELGYPAVSEPQLAYETLIENAGNQPIAIGGRAWNHWVAVRMGPQVAGRPDLDTILLMNPSPGYMGVGQVLTRSQFYALGPFSIVWLSV